MPHYCKDVTKQKILKKKALSFYTKYFEIPRLFTFSLFSQRKTPRLVMNLSKNHFGNRRRLTVKNKSNEHINKITYQNLLSTKILTDLILLAIFPN